MRRKKLPLRTKILNAINLPRYICYHTFGKNHTHIHRICVGFVVIAMGTVVAAACEHIFVVNIAALMLSKTCDGIGIVPVIDYVSSIIDEE